MTAADSNKTAGSQSQLVNITERVEEMARRFSSKRAVACPVGRDSRGNTTYDELTFAELADEINRYSRGLSDIGITKGMRTILMVRPSLEFFILTFALFKVGATVVLIDPGMGRKQLIKSLGEVEAEAFIGIPLAHVARVLFSKAFCTVKIKITVGRKWFWGGYTLRQIRSETGDAFPTAPTLSTDQAAIIFTSGSTGPAKGVVYEHRIFDAQVRYLESQYGYSPKEIDLPTFPLFALFDAALGMTAIIPDMDPTKPAEVDPERIISAIRDNQVSHMFGSPALLNRVSRYAEKYDIKFPTLKRVMTAGAPVPHAVLQRMRSLLPEEADIFTPYGATESLPVASIESREILGETSALTAVGRGICVGRPLEGMCVRIITISDESIETWADSLCLPQGEIGEICVKGPVVTKEYFRKKAATKLAKIADSDGIWHRMGDVGYLDEKGRLWFCGRKAHRVVTEKETMFTIPCEAIFNQHPKVYRSALVGVGAAGKQKPVLCVELEKGETQRPTAELLELAQRNPLTKNIETILYHPSFPVDVRHNAKIFREKLTVWAAEKTE